MQPTRSTTAAERKVIRWFFGIALVVALVYIGWAWHARQRECTDACRAKAFKTGDLRLNRGSRFDIGTHCECAK